MSRRMRRYFGEIDKATLLTTIGECRNASVKASSIAPISGDVYQACDKLRKAIDEVAEVLTGKRDHFHTPRHSTQNGPLTVTGPMHLNTGRLRSIEDYPEPNQHPQFALTL